MIHDALYQAHIDRPARLPLHDPLQLRLSLLQSLVRLARLHERLVDKLLNVHIPKAFIVRLKAVVTDRQHCNFYSLLVLFFRAVFGVAGALSYSLPPPRPYFPKFDLRKQDLKQRLADRPVSAVSDFRTFHVLDYFPSVLGELEIPFISKPPPIVVFDLTAIDDKPELRKDQKIFNLPSRKHDMQFITPLGFRNAVMLVAVLAVCFLSFPLFHVADPGW